MKVTAQIDMKKLEASLKKAATQFGDTTEQAVARWGVQTARELALSTQPFGSAGTRKKQLQAIETGMRHVLRIVDPKAFSRSKSSNKLESPQEISEYVESMRTGGEGHTRKRGQAMPICRDSDFKKALRMRQERAGIAKGGWIGAAQDIAKSQRGGDRITIGKNFLSWTQRHRQRGRVRKHFSPFRPSASLIHSARHTRSQYVLRRTDANRAIEWGAKKTLTWYRIAAKRALDK